METKSLLKPPISKSMKSGKVILLNGEEIGEHITDKREEIIIVLKGQATLITEDKKELINSGETKYISEGIKHNVINNSDMPLEYIYVVTLFE